jgi:3'-phosphoadenosine 5'-phosphosulfate sulfotransferase (PAPS reductase)/FAD synthetase
LVKVNPLADWTEEEVWAYVRANGVPHHLLYDRGYRSIGCAPCTRAIPPGADARSGRWWWETDAPKECGIHWTAEAGAGAPTGARVDKVEIGG